MASYYSGLYPFTLVNNLPGCKHSTQHTPPHTLTIPHPPCFSKPRRGVHSRLAIQRCQRNLKFHPSQPLSLLSPFDTLLLFNLTHRYTHACAQVCLVSTQRHTLERISAWTGKLHSCPAQARAGFLQQLYLHLPDFCYQRAGVSTLEQQMKTPVLKL